MHAIEAGRPLPQILAELADLGTSSDRAFIEELAERLDQGRIRILVAGEAKRGKSTVVNALLGRDVLPTGVTPVTCIATTIRYGRDERVEAATPVGLERCGVDALARLVTERGNPCNRLGLTGVVVYLDAPILARGVEFVDSPGTGSVHAHNTTEAQRALATMDAAIFVLTADPPISSAEQALLQQVARGALTTFVVLNKTDRLALSELQESLEFTRAQVAEATGRRFPVRSVSARTALTGHDTGFSDFTDDLLAYLHTRRLQDLRDSIGQHARGVAARLLDEVRLAQRAADMRSGDAAQRVARFRECLQAVLSRRQDAIDLARAESRRLLDALNEAAARDAATTTEHIRAELSELLAGPANGAAEDVERCGRAALVERARRAADDWRTARQTELQAGLSALETKLLQGLNAELAHVREAASDLLDLALSIPPARGGLVDNPRFFFNLTQNAGQTELLTGAVRRRLPGEFGRRRAREHIGKQAAVLIPTQIGRARADLQYRLTESTRVLVRSLERRYAASVDGLLAVVDAAVADRETADTDRAARHRQLAARERDLRNLLADLAGGLDGGDQPGQGAPQTI